MKIIFSSYDSIANPFYAGGGARVIHEVALRLVRHGHAVTVVCGSYTGSINRISDGVSYKHIGIKIGGPLIGQLVFILILPLYVLLESYDIWLEGFTPPVSTGFLPIFTSKPVIGITMLLHADKFAQKYRLPFHLVEKIGLKIYRNIISLNDTITGKIRRINPDCHVVTIPAGVKNNLFTLPLRRRRDYLLYLGRIDVFHKGLDILAQIMELVLRKRKNIRLIIAGGGHPQEVRRLKRIFREKKMDKNTVFKGKVEDHIKEMLLNGALIGVNSSRFESFGITALEFMAVGIPFICFGIEGFSWIPDDIAFKVEPLNIAAFAKKLIGLIDSQKRQAVCPPI